MNHASFPGPEMFRRFTRLTRFTPLGLFILGMFALSYSGCGAPEGIHRYERSGTVTFAGAPVAKGEIAFAPDRAKGGSGPGATVTFAGGTFCTRDTQGVVSGPHLVTISGFDGNQGQETKGAITHPWGKVLFREHRLEIDFPAGDSVHAFDILPEQLSQ